MLDEDIIAKLKVIDEALRHNHLIVSADREDARRVIANAIEELEWRQNCVVQLWVQKLTRMQQSVLYTSLRGPDGISKNHISKKLIRFLRRCVLKAAFDNMVYPVPYDPSDANWQSGSFTGPSCYRQGIAMRGTGAMDFSTQWFVARLWEGEDQKHQKRHPNWQGAMDEVVSLYLETVDELPHHFQLHFMHAAEIIGYKHPWPSHREWWFRTYSRLANDLHLPQVETEAQMDKRLGDREKDWRAAEEVTAHV